MAREVYFRHNGSEILYLRSNGEPTHILNIKRGILSAMHFKPIADNRTVSEVRKLRMAFIEEFNKGFFSQLELTKP